MTAEATESCTIDGIRLVGTNYRRLPYGSDQRAPDLAIERPRCHDCNVAWGGLHHYGCDMEECPLCGGQLISCDCRKPKAPMTLDEALADPQAFVDGMEEVPPADAMQQINYWRAKRDEVGRALDAAYVADIPVGSIVSYRTGQHERHVTVLEHGPFRPLVRNIHGGPIYDLPYDRIDKIVRRG
jgi:hypothetical protein